MMVAVPPSFFGFRSYLWDRLPEARPLITQVEAYGDDLDVQREAQPYELISEVFFHQLLCPAASSGDTDLALRCLEIVEEMLGSGDENLVTMVTIRVINQVPAEPRLVDLIRTRAGPQTARLVARIYPW